MHRRPDSRIVIVAVGIAALLLPLAHPAPFTVDMVQFGAAFGLAVASWDFFSGQTGEVSFAHPLFMGGAAYGAAVVQTKLGCGALAGAAVGGTVSLVFGLVLSLLTVRQSGAVFALTTMAAQLAFQRALFIWSRVFGAEEGLPVDFPYGARSMLYVATILISGGGCLIMTHLARRTGFGRRLRASGADPRIAMATGVAVGRVRSLGLMISAAGGGAAGLLMALQTNRVNQELAASPLAVVIFLLGTIGGKGSITGPWLAGLLYICVLRRCLMGLGPVEQIAASGILFGLVWLMPNGALPAVSNLIHHRTRKP